MRITRFGLMRCLFGGIKMFSLLLVASLYLPWIVFLGVVVQATALPATNPAKMRYERVPIEQFRLRPQARNHPLEYLQRLVASLLLGQLQPVGCLKDFTVIWGNGRVLAARLDPKITHLYAVILEEEISEKEFFRKQAVENFVQNPLSNAEKCKICCSYIRNEPSMLLKDIARDLGVDAAMISKWRRWEECTQVVQAALEADKIPLQTMVSISQLPKDQQEAALNAYLNPQKPAKGSNGNRTPKIKIPLANDNATGMVTVSGNSIDWDDTENLLKEALKAVRAAKDKNLDTKTAQSVWRDMARA
jgi:hypothetical protein